MYAIIGTVGGIYYYLLEFLWRGYSHPAMIAIGGISLLAVYYINSRYKNAALAFKSIAGAIAITLCELASGIIVNICLGWDIWDYSSLKYHFLGQISLRTSLLWLILCVPASMVCKITKEIFENKGDNCVEKGKET